ncbi:MAG: hypothetical protein QNJ14_09395, partial [Woeseiaceae bacterium]|nr:hypothetical protein [Woeseiaceae bacterium]
MSKFLRKQVCLGLAALLIGPVAWAVPGSWEFFENAQFDFDYAQQTDLPPGFGTGEFTFEMWVRLNDSYPVGSTSGGAGQLQNWSDSDNAPYSTFDWWYHGNFLIDGHNNVDFNRGTFSLQVYGGGRIRWIFGDGQAWAIQAYPASTTPSLLDGQWHQITLVRRWSGATSADLELWIDGSLVDVETSFSRTDMAATYWNTWSAFPAGEAGWFFAAEKQAARGTITQWEDYKGLIDEIRFWGRAKSPSEIAANYANPVTGSETGLLGHFSFGEAMGTTTCDSLNAARCIDLQNAFANVWSAVDAPLAGGGSDTQAPTVPTGVVATATSSTQIDLTWTASTDDVGVVAYDVRRDGVVVGSPSGTSFSDTGLTPNTTYSYTVSARDAAGNTSAESTAAMATTDATPDTTPPSVPTNLLGNAVSNTRIDLSWDASTDNVGVVAYDVRRDGVVVGSPSGTSFSDTGL